MARYRITGPDGRQYTITGPDDATDDELIAFVAEQADPRSEGAPVPSAAEYRKDLGLPERKKPGYFSGETAAGLLQSVNQGLGFGFADEAVAGIGAALGRNPETGGYFDYSRPLGKSYGANLAAERGALKQFRKDRPYTAMGAEIVGAAPTMLATGGTAAAARPGMTLAGRVGEGAKAGGIYGSLYGAGAAEGDWRDMVEGAVKGGGVGALFGMGIPLTMRGAGMFGNWIQNQAARFSPQRQASLGARKSAEALMRDAPGAAPEEAIFAAQERTRGMGPAAVLADSGENARGFTGALARTPGRAKTIIESRIRPRQEGTRDPDTGALQGGQAGRTGAALDELVPERALATRTGLQSADDVERGFYRQAYAANQQMDSPLIRRILKTPEAADALEVAATRAQNKMTLAGKSDPELTALYREVRELGKVADKATGVGVAKGLKLETLDYVKRGLQQVWRSGRNSENAVVRERAQNAKRLAGKLTEELDRLDVTARAGPKSLKIEGGEYARARGLAQKRIRAREAVSSGEKFMNKSTFKNSDEIKAAIDEMTPEELHTFRIGVVQALRDKMGNVVRRGDITKQLSGKPELERKIRLAFGDDRMFRRYIDVMENEGEMFRTYAEIFGGSPTARREAEAAMAAQDPNVPLQVVTDAATGNWRGLLGGLGRAAARKPRSSLPGPVREQAAEIMMGRDIAPLQRGAEAARLSEANRQALQKALLLGTIPPASRSVAPVNRR